MKHRAIIQILLQFAVGLFIATTASAQSAGVLEQANIDLVIRKSIGEGAQLDVEWYAPKDWQNFVVSCRDLVSGETRKVVVEGKRIARLASIDPQKDYEISVTALDGVQSLMGRSPTETWLGEPSRQARAEANLTKATRAPTLNETLRSLDSNNFPFIFTNVTIDTGGIAVAGLTTANFTAQEDGRLQTDFFQVTPPQQGGGVRILDFIFLIDNSGSMEEEQQAVKDNVSAFVDSLVARKIDFRLGLVRFGQDLSSGQPILVNNGTMTNDVNLFKSWLNQLTIDGGIEPGLLAVERAATGFSFRAGSQRHFLLITDEPNNGGGSLSQALAACQSNSVVVHSAVDCNVGNSNNDYCNATSIRGATGGRLFNVVGPYRDILDVLTQDIGSTYIVRYRSDNPVCDGKQREVRITVNAFGQSDFVLGYYTPCAAPLIRRTQATIDLSKTAQLAGVALTIAAEVTDAVAPFVQSVTLFYRTTGATTYNALAMSPIGGNIYQTVIPAGAVLSPGLDYYITATDGQSTSSDPAVDPVDAPYQIAVLPNQPPQITHTPVTEAKSGDNISISATVVDNTNNLSQVSLYFREFGTLVFSSVTMTAAPGNQYRGTIPGSQVTAAGVEYYIRAVDDFGLASVHGIHKICVDCSTPPSDSCGFSDDFEAGVDNWLFRTPTSWGINVFGSDQVLCLGVPNPSGDEYAVQRGEPWREFTLTLNAKSDATSNRNFFVLFGVTDMINANLNGYYLQFATGGVRLYRTLGNRGTQIAFAPGDYVTDTQFHAIAIERKTPNIKISVDGVTLIEVNDATFAMGSIGFGSFNSEACFDDVRITGVRSRGADHFVDTFGDGNANGWAPLTASRWQVRSDGGSLSYFLNTSNYESPDGRRMGEISLLSDSLYSDFVLECQARSVDAGFGIEGADLCLAFGYQDFDSYYYVNFNSGAGLTQLHRVHDGGLITLGTYNLSTFADGFYHTLRIERAGSQIRAFFDGVELFVVTDSFFGAGLIGVGSYNDSGYFDNIHISRDICRETPASVTTIVIPKGLTVPAGSSLAVPIIVTTQSAIGIAQFTVEYDGNDLRFDNVTVGSDAPGFTIGQQNSNPPFPPTTPGTNRNLLVQISGGGANSFTGNDKTVAVLHFTAIGTIGATTPLALDTDCSHTFLTTTTFTDLCGSQITFSHGDATIVQPLLEISGNVRYYNASRPVPNATVSLTGAATATTATDAAGFYRFGNLNTGSYTWTPSKTGDVRSAIRGSDALKILQALAFVVALTPDEKMAANVDGNSSVSGADAVAVLRYLAFLNTGAANVGQWKFAPASYSQTINASATGDFKAYLLGDVSGDWGASAPLASGQTAAQLMIGPAQWHEKELRVPLRVPENAATVYSVVASLDWEMPAAMEFRFEPAREEVYAAVNNLEKSKTHLALARLNGFAPGELIGELIASVSEPGDATSPQNGVLGQITALQVNDVELAGDLIKDAAVTLPMAFALYANYPNPFNAQTAIRFAIPVGVEKTEMRLEIYSIYGRLVRQLLRGSAQPGYHTQVWDGRDDHGQLVTSGVYIYRLRAGEFVANKRLLLLK